MTALLEPERSLPGESVRTSSLDSETQSGLPRRMPPPSPSLAPALVRWPVLWPLLGLFIASVILTASPLDVWISSCCYSSSLESWTWSQSGWSLFLYRYGPLFPLAIAIGALIVFLYGLVGRQAESIFRASLFLVLVMVVGPGLTVNSVLKRYSGRPRPNQIENFGGPHSYTPLVIPGSSLSRNASFPSGHAAMAFYLMAPAFVVGQDRPRQARRLLAFGLMYGGAMGLARIVQGGHFASDILWSAGIVYFTCVIFASLILRVSASPETSWWNPGTRSLFRGALTQRCAS